MLSGDQARSRSHLFVAIELTVDATRWLMPSILAHKNLKFKGRAETYSRSFESSPERTASTSLRFDLTRLQSLLSSVLVCGVSNVNRAVINDLGQGRYNLLGVIATMGVDGLSCVSNHVDEMQRVLGIEAARATIIRETRSTMDGHGLTIDFRHTSLLADIMCYRGRVRDITLSSFPFDSLRSRAVHQL